MSKIKVDARTFKIINQEKSTDQKSEATSDSESESSASLYSENDSIKVIKLGGSEQNGGKDGNYEKNNKKTFQAEQELKQQSPLQSTLQSSQQLPPNNFTLNQVRPIATSTISQNIVSDSVFKPTQTKIESYLKNPTDNPRLEETISSESELSDKSETIEIQDNVPIKNQSHQVEVNGSTDIIDLTKYQLHEILYSIFTDAGGNNISENIEKMSKLFETHNQIMEKILNQIIIMNSNYTQMKVPEVIQTNTKQAKGYNQFRENIKHFEQK
jgi:hypothetical protein